MNREDVLVRVANLIQWRHRFDSELEFRTWVDLLGDSELVNDFSTNPMYIVTKGYVNVLSYKFSWPDVFDAWRREYGSAGCSTGM